METNSVIALLPSPVFCRAHLEPAQLTPLAARLGQPPPANLGLSLPRASLWGVPLPHNLPKCHLPATTPSARRSGTHDRALPLLLCYWLDMEGALFKSQLLLTGFSFSFSEPCSLNACCNLGKAAPAFQEPWQTCTTYRHDRAAGLGTGRQHSNPRVLRAMETPHRAPGIMMGCKEQRSISAAAWHTGMHQTGLYPFPPSFPPIPVQSGGLWLAEVCCCPSVTRCALQSMPHASSPLAQEFLDSRSQRALAMENFLHLKLTFFSSFPCILWTQRQHLLQFNLSLLDSKLSLPHWPCKEGVPIPCAGCRHPWHVCPNELLLHASQQALTHCYYQKYYIMENFLPASSLLCVQQKAADTLGGCPRWWHLWWLLWIPVTATSAEHNSHTMPTSKQRMLFIPHLWPPLSALRSGSL